MANRIAGITIEISGDTSKLTSALKDVDKNLKNTQTNLRDVNKLLKLDPTNVDLLKQKQGYLTQAIGDTSERLTTLKTALQQMKDSDTSGKVTEQQKALEREIANTEQKLEGLKKEYKDFGGVASQQLKVAGEKMKELGGKMTEVGKGLTTHVTAPIAAVGAGAVASWKEVDEAMDTVAKKTGKTGKELEGLQESAKNIATTIPTSFQTAAEAVGEVNTRFGVTGDKLEKLSTQFVKFADLNDTDVTTSIDSVQKAMEAMNVPTEDAGKFLDLLTAAAQNSGADVGKLTDNIVKNAAAFDDMGLSAEDAVGLMAELEKSGVNADEAMTGLKKAFQNAAKQGKPTKEVLRDVQKAIQGAGSDTEATNEAMEIFGKKAGGNIAKAVRDGKISFEDMGKALGDYAGSVDKTFTETKDPLDDVTIAMNNMKDIGADIVETSAPMISEVMGQLRDIIEDLSEKWNSLNDDQKQMIVKVALVIAAVGPLVTILGGVVTAVGSIVGGIGGLIGLITGGSGAVAAAGAATTAVEGVTAAVGTTAAGGGLIATLGGLVTAAAPFLIGGAVIVGVIAAVALLVKNWDKVKAAAKKLWEGIKKAWENVKKKTAEVFKNVADTAKQKFDAAKASVKTAADNIKSTVSTKFSEAKTAVSTAASNIASNVKKKLSSAASTAKEKASDIKSKISTGFSDAASAVKTKAGEISDSIKDKAGKAIDDFNTKVGGVADKVKNGLYNAKVQAWNIGYEFARNLQSGAGNAVDNFLKKIKSISDTVKDALKKAKEKASKFTWTIPKPKMPHIKLEYDETTIFGKTYKYPTGFKTEWYKRAYQNPVMFTRPTILQTPYGNKGFGDGRGGEIVLSDSKLRQIAGSGEQNITFNIYGGNQSVNAIADAVQNRMIALQKQREAAGLA